MENLIEVLIQNWRNLIGLLPEMVELDRISFAKAIGIGLLISVVLIQVVWRLVLKIKLEREGKQFALELIHKARQSQSIEQFADYILDMVCEKLTAQSYAFYKLDPKTDKYLLSSVRYTRDDLVEVGPNYSGLAPYKKEEYLQRVSVDKSPFEKTVQIVKDGNVPVLELTTEDQKSLIRISPVKKLPKKTQKSLSYFIEAVGKTYELILDVDEFKNRIDTFSISDSAVDKVVSTLGSQQGLIYMMLGLCIKKTNATSGVYIKKLDNDLVIESMINIPGNIARSIQEDPLGLKEIFDISQGDDIFVLSKNDPQFYSLPPFFTINEVKNVVFMNIIEEKEKVGLIILLKQGEAELEGLEKDDLKALHFSKNKFQELMGVHEIMKIISENFQNSLHGLMELLDNIQPYSVGYSELMARYSYIIADEMGYPEDERDDIFQAASLSNIGVLGLSNDLFFKSGKYSDFEYEAMKFHAEAGARIIESTLGNKRIADFVRYHHERIDGMGYPLGLKGDEIPSGAKIIAVVQYFLAKINGREGRDPVKFDEALESLALAKNSQLDAKSVDALINWFAKKREAFGHEKKTLGSCWDMRCSTKEICIDCPAYQNTEKNCWEFEGRGIKCHEHGNVCSTCYIKSEVMGRQS